MFAHAELLNDKFTFANNMIKFMYLLVNTRDMNKG